MSKEISNKQFYMHALKIAVPMILQALITNFVSMLDNIMIGSVGTAEMSGVSIANQFIFIFNITIFGGVSGAGIFGTQYFGKGDSEGQKYTVRYRLIVSAIIFAIGAAIFWFAGEWLVSLYISKDDAPELVASTLMYGKQYLTIMILGLVPFAFGQAYASVVRECGETKIPMIGSLAAIVINVVLDYVLIFGKFGAPCLGVRGAAIATVIAKTVEALVVILWVHFNPARNPYIIGIYKSVYIPWQLVKDITIKGLPLLANELLWSLGISLVAQAYSARGINVVAARNIASTIVNLFNVLYIQFGGAIGIIVGIELGAGNLESAPKTAKKLIRFSVLLSCIAAVAMLPFAFFFPEIYKTEEEVRKLAAYFIIVQALAQPLWAYTNATYFTIRSGGRTGITFLFDFLFTWAVMLPLAYILSLFTTMDIHWMFAIVTYSEILKCIVGFFMVKSGIWVNNMVDE